MSESVANKMKRPFLFSLFLLSQGYLLYAQIPLKLLNDINTDPGGGGSYPKEIVNIKSTIFFAGNELWKSDGTTSGTSRVSDIINNDGPLEPVLLSPGNASLFFMARSQSGLQLWVSDGSKNGTRVVKSEFESFSTYIDTIITIKNTAFLYIHSNQKVELWKSDGTSEGTSLVKQITSNSDKVSLADCRTKLTSYIDHAFFNVYDENGSGSLWKSDGTTSGTILVKENLVAQTTVIYNNTLFIRESDTKLWSTNGTPEGTTLRITSNFGDFEVVNNTLYFTSPTRGELWKTDGTTSGTFLVKNNLYNFGELCAVGDRLYFIADNGINGAELWRTDGTTEGTVLVYETLPETSYRKLSSLSSANGKLFFIIEYLGLYMFDGANATPIIGDGISSPSALTPINNVLYFSAWRFKPGTTTHYPELWRSDGTEQGTYMLTGTANTTASSLPNSFIRIPDALFFTAYKNNDWGLFRTQGTVESLKYVGKCYDGGVPLGTNTIVFGNDDGLWKMKGDGTEAVLIEDFGPDPNSISTLKSIGNLAFFSCNTESGKELWKTDGTKAGTTLVKDIYSGPASSFISYQCVFKEELYFAVDDGIHGTELWKTNGTEAGTIMVKDIVPGSAGGTPRFFIATENFLYFSAYQPATGFQLWKSDGTEAGTAMVKLLSSGITWMYTSLNNIVYFGSYDDGTGQELWRSDGTETGTFLVKDINPGPESSNIIEIAVLDGVLFFSANDGVHHNELWKSDGTNEGTVLVQDIYKGRYSSEIRKFIILDHKLYFIAKDDTHGFEVWKTSANGCGAQMVTDDADIVPEDISYIGQRLIAAARSEAFGSEIYYYDISNDPVEKLPLTISFDVPAEIRYNDNLKLSAKTESTTPVQFVSSDNTIGLLQGDLLTITDLGSVTITASHEGDELYCPAKPVSHKLDVSQALQSIVFEAIPTGDIGDDIDLVASASSGLDVTFSSASENLTLNNASIQLLEAGKSSVTAQQAGNAYYLPATKATQVFCINPPVPVIQYDKDNSKLISSIESGNQWFKDGDLLPGENLNTLVLVDNSGTYTVNTTIHECTSEMSIPLTVIITGLEENTSDIRIYPNPFHENLIIDFTESSNEVQLFNMVGQKTTYSKLNGKSITIDTQYFAPGIYILKTHDKSGVMIKKVVKE